MEMGKKGSKILCPYDGAIILDGKGVDSIEIEGLKVAEVRWCGIHCGVVSQADVDMLSVLEEAALSHVRQDAEFSVRGVPPLGAGFLSSSENVKVFTSGET